MANAGIENASSSRIALNEGKASNGMRKTLEDLMNILQCPLCHQVCRQDMIINMISCRLFVFFKKKWKAELATRNETHFILWCYYSLETQIFKRPTTLASCGHSFCETCIDDYNCIHSTCPATGCGMPMSIVGGGRGSFRKVNPQLAQCVESMQLVCQGLNQAPDEWWKSNDLVITQSLTCPTVEHGTSYDDTNKGLSYDSDSDSDMENMIDLQSG